MANTSPAGFDKLVVDMAELEAFVEKNGHAPSPRSKNPAEKKLGCLLSNYRANYATKKKCMSDSACRAAYEAALERTPVLAPPVADMEKVTEDMAEIEAFANEHGRAPSMTSKDPAEKKLGCLLSNYRANYATKKKCMSDSVCRAVYETALARTPVLQS
jgi:hypothetical protein